MVHKAGTLPPVAMGHIRGHGYRDLLIYCPISRSRRPTLYLELIPRGYFAAVCVLQQHGYQFR